MAAVDRNVLRMAVWELIAAPDVPAAVVISEAVGLAADLSTDASPAFVNGVLARIRDAVPRGLPRAPADPEPQPVPETATAAEQPLPDPGAEQPTQDGPVPA